MFRAWKFIFLMMMSILLLAGCGQTLDESATAGIEAARVAFEAGDKNHTEEIDGIKLYKPAGFTISENSDAQNIVFTKNDETFILFVNPNEESDSRLFHELLLADENKKILAQSTYKQDDLFGFAAVLASGDDKIELIASVGGTKITTLTKKKNIEVDLAKMMEIVRSIEHDS